MTALTEGSPHTILDLDSFQDDRLSRELQQLLLLKQFATILCILALFCNINLHLQWLKSETQGAELIVAPISLYLGRAFGLC